MFENLDADDLYAELLMLRANDRRAFILVEGWADCAVFDRFINADVVITVPAHGKSRALGAIERIYAETRLASVYSILDRDWVGFLDEGVDHHAVVYTEFYDLDACIFFAGGIYEALAANFCTDLSFRRGTSGCTYKVIRDDCVELALPLGVLRYMSHRDSLGLNLRDFPLGQAVKNLPDGVDLIELVKLACKRAKKDPADYQYLIPILQRELASAARQEHYCSGHDLAKAFSLIAKQRWASKVGHDIVERSARAAFSRDLFEQSSVYHEGKRWATSLGVPIWGQP